jgi:hypothetical protein
MGRYDVLLEQDKPAVKPERQQRANTQDSAPRQRETRDARENQTQSQPVPPVHPVRPVLPVRGSNSIKRVMKSRHPFDIYQDQYESLKELALEERMQGGEGSMSAMVREALDAFIQKRRLK